MCWEIVSYREYSCGIRHCTHRASLDCNQETCRLSKVHGAKKKHICPDECKGDRSEEHHLVMDVMPHPCQICQEIGRMKHLGLPDYAANGINYQYVQ